MHGALDDEMPARNVTYGTPSPITNPSRWMMESVKSVPFGSLRCILPVSRSRRSRAVPRILAFLSLLPALASWSLFFGEWNSLLCAWRERERVWKGKKRGFLLLCVCVVLGKLLWCEDGEEQELQSASQKGEEQEPGTASEGTTH